MNLLTALEAIAVGAGLVALVTLAILVTELRNRRSSDQTRWEADEPE